MHEEVLRRLQERLERRRKRLLECHEPELYGNLKRLWAFLVGQPALRGTLAELEQKAHDPHVRRNVDRATSGDPPDENWTPECDLDHAAVAYNVINEVVRFDWNYDHIKGHYILGYGGTWHAGFRDRAIIPLFDYLLEALDDRQVTLSQLLRYQQRCEWFRREELNDLVKKHRDETVAAGRKKLKIEDVLKKDLYCYLHDQGLDFTIEPKSAVGEIDLIADQ